MSIYQQYKHIEDIDISAISNLVISENTILEPNTALSVLDGLDKRLSAVNFNLQPNISEIISTISTIVVLFGGSTYNPYN